MTGFSLTYAVISVDAVRLSTPKAAQNVGMFVGIGTLHLCRIPTPDTKRVSTMPLTDTAIRTAKSGPKLRKLSDGGGLQLWITPNGSKLWRFAYRFDGKQKLLAIGSYPTIPLADARAARDLAKRQLASGLDPSIQKQVNALVSQQARTNTFEQIARELLDKKHREGKASATISKREWLYGLANAQLGKRPVAEIKAAEVLAVLKAVENKGQSETAHRLRSCIGEVFRFAIATTRAENDPTSALRGALAAPKSKHRAAITVLISAEI
jgi:hypothetical protein